MEKIPTAEEFFSGKPNGWADIEYWSIEFTKLHVKAALEKASQLAKEEHYNCDNQNRIYDNYQILNCYPLENIK